MIECLCDREALIKLTSSDTPEHNIQKTNLLCYNKILKKSMRLAKILYFSSCFKNYKNDIKKTWSTISKVLSPPSKKEYPEFLNINNTKIYDKNKIANSFNQFFSNIGHNLAEQISTDSNLNYGDFLLDSYGDFLLDKTESRLHFETVSEDYVSKLIKKLPNKSSCGYDNISLKLIKYLNTLITPRITTIKNQMINTGTFPDGIKIAKVKPIYKKNDTHTINIYRPISFLPSVSKIFEKIIYHQTYSYFHMLGTLLNMLPLK